MMNFRYCVPTEIMFGPGSLRKLYRYKMPGKKALIVTTKGKSVKKNGYLDRVQEALEKAGAEYEVFDRVEPNPILQNITDGAKLAQDTGCDFVIGLGGGSALDSAKAIAAMATNSGESVWDYMFGITGGKKQLEAQPLPIIAITTTAGTGSEVDSVAVITKEETNEKLPLVDNRLYPVLAVVDPELMVSVPPQFTAFQGFDAFFHAAESVINRHEHVLGEMYALKAIEYIAKYLPEAVKNGENIEARSYVALANTYAGLVMLCTSEHAIEHAMSAFHGDLPHGAGLIMISLAYFRCFAESGVCDELFVKMAKAMGNEKADKPMDFVDALENLQKACGVYDLKMSDYGIAKEDIPDIVKNARSTMGSLFMCDKVRLKDEDVEKILLDSYK